MIPYFVQKVHRKEGRVDIIQYYSLILCVVRISVLDYTTLMITQLCEYYTMYKMQHIICDIYYVIDNM